MEKLKTDLLKNDHGLLLVRKGEYMHGQGIFMGHETCPACRTAGKDSRGDNMGRWEDGHAHCFSCGYREPSTAEALLKNVLGAIPQNGEDVKRNKQLSLPHDAQKTIDVKPLRWLDKYGIIREEIIENDVRWSEARQWLCFPYRDGEGNLLAYQARTFPQFVNREGEAGMVDINTSKWMTFGSVEDLTHIIGFTKHPDDVIIVVEDVVSAIKVGRHCRALPLFGSTLSARRVLRLRFLCKKLVLWLDQDKYAHALREAKKVEMVGIESQVIYTDKDPKEYSDEDIKIIIA